jgi:hypothetical protein
MAYPRNTSERFWSKVDKHGPDECWEYMGHRDTKGYGVTKFMDVCKKAHRMAWVFTFGAVPEGEGYHGTCVLHKCDNPPCCNPNHLFLGTIRDNIKDMDSKHRRSTTNLPPTLLGEQSPTSKLTGKQIMEIRNRPNQRGIYADVSRDYGISQTHAAYIIKGRVWKHLLPDLDFKADV